jgi:AcrR family transcriptional regulator
MRQDRVSGGTGTRQSSRQRAVDAMAEAIGEYGYPDTTVGDVLSRARMSRRTFYELFANREECFLATYDHARSKALAWLDGEAARAQGCPRPLADLLAEVLDYLAEQPDFARVLVVEPPAVGPPGIDRHERTMAELADWLAARRADGAELGHDELRLRCEASIGAIHRVLAARIVAGRASDLPALAADLSALVAGLVAAGCQKHTPP